jgi:hypothetical protein
MSSSIVKGDCIPTITLEEAQGETDCKGNWVQLDDTALIGMFSSVIVANNQEEELGSEYAFHRVRDEEYFMEKFPNFPDEVYTILATEQIRLDQEREKIGKQVDKMENEIVDLERNINDLAIAMGK